MTKFSLFKLIKCGLTKLRDNSSEWVEKENTKITNENSLKLAIYMTNIKVYIANAFNLAMLTLTNIKVQK